MTNVVNYGISYSMLHISISTLFVFYDALLRYICLFDVDINDAAFVGCVILVDCDCVSDLSTVLCNIILFLLLSFIYYHLLLHYRLIALWINRIDFDIICDQIWTII